MLLNMRFGMNHAYAKKKFIIIFGSLLQLNLKDV